MSGFLQKNGGGGGTTGNSASSEVPSGTINGINTVFTLAHAPSPANTLQLFLNGTIQQAGGGDFTLVGPTITFVNAPVLGSVLLAFYGY